MDLDKNNELHGSSTGGMVMDEDADAADFERKDSYTRNVDERLEQKYGNKGL